MNQWHKELAYKAIGMGLQQMDTEPARPGPTLTTKPASSHLPWLTTSPERGSILVIPILQMWKPKPRGER